jgi:hypothetical protein
MPEGEQNVQRPSVTLLLVLGAAGALAIVLHAIATPGSQLVQSAIGGALFALCAHPLVSRCESLLWRFLERIHERLHSLRIDR